MVILLEMLKKYLTYNKIEKMARLIYRKIEFTEEQTKAINEMKRVWEKELALRIKPFIDDTTNLPEENLEKISSIIEKYI